MNASIESGEVHQVNAVADVNLAHKWARTLEDAEAKRLGVPVTDVRPSVARKLGISPGTLEGIRRFRTKIIPNWIMARIRLEFVALLQSEIRRLEHEIHIARQAGADHRDNDLAAAETQLCNAKKILENKT